MTFRLVLSMTALAVIAACQSARLDLPTDTEIDASRERVVDAGEIIVVTPSRAAARNMISKAVSLGYEAHGEEMMTGLGVVMLTLEMPEGQDGDDQPR